MPIVRCDGAADADMLDRATARAATPAANAAPALRTEDFRPGLNRVDKPPEPVLERYFGLPPEHLARARDVGLPHLRIVHRQCLEDDLARRARDLQDDLRELDQRELSRIAEVHRQVLLARRE